MVYFKSLIKINPNLKIELSSVLGDEAEEKINDWKVVAENLPKKYKITSSLIRGWMDYPSPKKAALSFLNYYQNENGTIVDLMTVLEKCNYHAYGLISKTLERMSIKSSLHGCIFCENFHPSLDFYSFTEDKPKLLSDLASLLGAESDKDSNWLRLALCINEVLNTNKIQTRRINTWKHKSPTEAAQSLLNSFRMSLGSTHTLSCALNKCNLKAAKLLHDFLPVETHTKINVLDEPIETYTKIEEKSLEEIVIKGFWSWLWCWFRIRIWFRISSRTCFVDTDFLVIAGYFECILFRNLTFATVDIDMFPGDASIGYLIDPLSIG